MMSLFLKISIVFPKPLHKTWKQLYMICDKATESRRVFFYLLQFISVVLCVFSVILCGPFAVMERQWIREPRSYLPVLIRREECCYQQSFLLKKFPLLALQNREYEH